MTHIIPSSNVNYHTPKKLLFDLEQMTAQLYFPHIAMSEVLFDHTTLSGMPEKL